MSSEHMRRIGWLISAALLLCAGEASALDETYEDLSASVEVAPVFSFSLDRPLLSFGLIGPNATAILGEGHFFNAVTCRSNSGRPWYLKAQLLSLKHLDSGFVLPPNSLKWKVVGSTSSAQPVGNPGTFQPLAADAVLIYIGQGDDLKGQEVVLRFQYSLTTPPEAPAGNYVGELIFTMAESP